MQGVLGLAVIMALAWLLGERRRVNFQRIAVGLGLQFGLALLFLRLPGMSGVFLWLNKVTEALSDATLAGCSFLFGYLGGGPLPFAPAPGASTWIFAFVSLPMIIVLSALSAVLFHWGILQHVVRGFSFLLRKSMGLGGALGVGVAANVFMGMVEAPLLIRHYLRGLTHSELFALMTTGMATIAGTVLVLYATVLAPVLDNALGQILTASIISCPAALLIAELMVPESGPPSDGGEIDAQYRSGMDALSAGTSEGLKLYMNVAATLLVYVALTHLINTMVGALPDVEGQPLSLQRCFGWLFAPLAWLLGVPWAECPAAGQLLGTKAIINELVAYMDMAALPSGTFSPRSILILTYALCGFANPGSVGIMLGGIGSMAPERRQEILSLGLRAAIGGLLASCMTGAVIGIIG
ncbi:MAG TPA: nucleoside:proton symporter [Candidatus Bilophila faecipullorum]|uniref:Nucleoside:proton symporter n=1 Tax=Candidatus Bilophila faecipullorum TaxID=2838482 RepID=A0A9D1QY76_9BACT|nr:nucleoside transporter C-terminal domain-containing protein [uncultured Bilophila sp.]HIW77824.1 nucleoside:proton symporter [Candidatus Bilophila faecipullorum]